MIDLCETFEKYDNDFLEFEKIPQNRRLSARRDLCGMMLLDKLAPSKGRILAGAEHDEVWLDVNVDTLAEVATEEDILTLVRCGIRYDSDHDCLHMFA